MFVRANGCRLYWVETGKLRELSPMTFLKYGVYLRI